MAFEESGSSNIDRALVCMPDAIMAQHHMATALI